MLPIPSTYHDDAVRFIALHRAFDLPKGHPSDSLTAAKAALCEALSFVTPVEFTLGELFALSDKLLSYRDDACENGEPAIYPIHEIAEAAGVSYRCALLAAKLCGAYRDDEASGWRDDGDGHPVMLNFEEWET